MKEEGGSTPVATFRTQGQAWERAKAIARRERSEAVLHGKDGRIRERNTYGADSRGSRAREESDERSSIRTLQGSRGCYGGVRRFHVKALHMGSDDHRWRRPRSYHHGNLKEVLLEAARKLIEQYGPAGFSLTEAARLAGVGRRPLPAFPRPRCAARRLARNGFERFAARFDLAWNNGIPTPLSAFENLGRAYLAFAREEPASYAVMFEAGLGVSGDEQLKVAADRAFDVLQRAASALCRALPPDRRPPVKLMSLHVWALSHGVADLFVEARPGAMKLPLTSEEILKSAMLVYLRGLGILPPENQAPAPNP